MQARTGISSELSRSAVKSIHILANKWLAAFYARKAPPAKRGAGKMLACRSINQSHISGRDTDTEFDAQNPRITNIAAGERQMKIKKYNE